MMIDDYMATPGKAHYQKRDDLPKVVNELIKGEKSKWEYRNEVFDLDMAMLSKFEDEMRPEMDNLCDGIYT